MPIDTALSRLRAPRPAFGWTARLPLGTTLAFWLAALAVASITLFAYRADLSRSETAEAMSRGLEGARRLQGVLSTLKDAETGQRGFLLTGQEEYLRPFRAAQASLDSQFRQLRELSADDPQQLVRIAAMEKLAGQKLQELTETVELQRTGRAGEALALVRTDRGRSLMEQIRELATVMESREQDNFATRREAWNDAVEASRWVTWGGASLLLVFIAAAAGMARREHRARETEAWIRGGQAELSESLQGDVRLEHLGEQALAAMARYLDAVVGRLYVTEADGSLRCVASHALAKDAGADDVVPAGSGLLGQAARERRALRIHRLPAGYLRAASSTGASDVAGLLIQPAIVDRDLQGIVELGFFRELHEADEAYLERASSVLAVALRSSRDRTRIETLLAETQRQSEELQTQQEELRVSNEELEEQSRALRESQVRLENQQAELEQTNTQLEEQAQELESQRDELGAAQEQLVARADELERANQYKSEFLANMSHELRTPLNSTLILARLLADNKRGNLDEEQVKFAQTIVSAGNDLLTLINDILDLSKIEAGKVELQLGPVTVQALVEAMSATFEPLASQRGLRMRIETAPGTPPELETDELRCGQVLKNLLSNAIKFTEAGEVALKVRPGDAPGSLAFDVSDTGIGIAEHQREFIFEAFRQADGSTHRKYGGTGLGLSIARDLARLLGGDITLASVPGEGSTFTLTLPVAARPAPAEEAAPPPARDERPAPATPAPRIRAGAPAPQDDREKLDASSRVILVIEDDPRFADILRDLIREQGYLCVIAGTASEGLACARRFLPRAILLDMNLPDHSGLSVLDQLKRESSTRHIPVHIISVADRSQEALEMGAVGYALKPVKREDLVQALNKLEARFSQDVRRVLVVEDDPRQRESVAQLLAADDVQIVGAETAAQALAQLRSSTFDCMVLDLSLPDLSGHELLEQMSVEEGVAFPPVIVYTGHALTADEEQKLRRRSRAIIIKDARSPERLLDEVTLFLHQVESRLPAERQRMLREARNRETALEGKCVLVVEDDVRNIFALSAVLEPKGMRVEIARNGREALERLSHHGSLRTGAPIDLVLMDIMMPEMDGLTAIREIRKRPELARLPIIALTAKAMRDDQERCLAAGANDYIAKPLDIDRLLSLVRVWMPR